MGDYDMDAPWNQGVNGSQVLPLINEDKPIIRVEAGPGTGKTFGLIRRVQRLLHPSGLAVEGDRVVIVAFNRVIAKKLSEDIRAALKSTDHEAGPIIKTVHGFCLHVIGGKTRILLPHERIAMLCDLMHERPELRQKYPTRKKLEQRFMTTRQIGYPI